MLSDFDSEDDDLLSDELLLLSDEDDELALLSDEDDELLEDDEELLLDEDELSVELPPLCDED